MNKSISIAPVHKSVVVETTPQEAFEAFTARIDRWWPKTHGIGAAPIRETIIEPFVGGRWYTKCEDGSDVVVGHVRIWNPGERFVVSWEISADWKPDARASFASELELRFVADADGRTRVELEHRNFEKMGAAAGETMRRGVDGGWPMLLDLFAKEASTGIRPGCTGREAHAVSPRSRCAGHPAHPRASADVLLAPQLDFFRETPEWKTLTAEGPNLRGWLERMNARPSMQATTWERVAAMTRH